MRRSVAANPLFRAGMACLLVMACTGPATTPAPVNGVPNGFWWNSGEQQCQTGNMKLVYHYIMQPSTDPAYQWELYYSVKSENLNASGVWKTSPTLYRLYYFFTWQGGAQPTTGNIDLNYAETQDGTLFRGDAYVPFDMRVLTLKRWGGATGIETTWPNSQGCVSS
jgi:hypothetical protein